MGLESIAYAVDRIAWCAINPSPCAGSDLIHLSISHLSGLEFTRQCYAGASSDADALTTLQAFISTLTNRRISVMNGRS